MTLHGDAAGGAVLVTGGSVLVGGGMLFPAAHMKGRILVLCSAE